jgi:L-arabinokinase
MTLLRYYVSGHGLGHASRSCQIINTLRRRHPDIFVEVVSDAPPWFLTANLDPSVAVRRRSCDIGVLQRDSLVMNEEATLVAYRDFSRNHDALVAEEARSLSEAGVALVVADIPPAPFAAAGKAGIPAVGLSNFSWDWIYEGLLEKYPGYDDVIEGIRADYRCADRLLCLPFSGDFPAFPRQEELPLVARRSGRDASEIRRELAIDPGKRIGLISFGSFGLQGFDFSPLEKLTEWIFLTEPGLAGANLRILPRGSRPYPELVSAADVVITKPGYGIVSEAIAHGTAVLYSNRGDFREQALLVDGLHRYTRALEIGNDALRSGDWGAGLESLLALPQPKETIATNGDIVAADRLAQLARQEP